MVALRFGATLNSLVRDYMCCFNPGFWETSMENDELDLELVQFTLKVWS